MIEFFTTFFALFVTDILYTYYVRAVTTDKPLTASFWAAVVTLTASIAVINYTENHLMLIPALLGAFAGTYVGMKVKLRV
jgi:hypothetical protein